MPFRTVDLRCPSCAATSHDRLVPRDDTAECACGTKMVVYFPTRSQRADAAFTPITAGGQTYSTRSEWDGYVRRMQKQTGDPYFGDRLVGHTPRTRREALDEHLDATVADYKAHDMNYHAAQQRLERAYSRSRP